ncbi:MAG: hypothetical protein O8C67_04530 [Candidatus Methanoperedens sp.]|nr:hypothetical protein [Candidatus Methanoperedens sp.]
MQENRKSNWIPSILNIMVGYHCFFLNYMMKKDLLDKQKLVAESRGMCLKKVSNEKESVVDWPLENSYSASRDFEKEHSLAEFQLLIYMITCLGV